MLSRLFKMWLAQAISFHRVIRPFLLILLFLAHYFNVSIWLWLDQLFFPEIRQKKIVKPIVIVGNPRSGTTFLQRFLVENDFGAGTRLWKMLFPALTLQYGLRPFLPLLERFSPARHHTAQIHKTSLTAIETDDPALLFRYFDGFFVYGFFLAWAREELRVLFDPKYRDTSTRDFDYWEQLWIRNLVGEQQTRIIPKLFSLSMRLPKFLERFPDAKILYLIRDPLQCVPSGLSLVTGVLDSAFGFWQLPSARRAKFIGRLYRGLTDLSLSFHDDYINGRIPKANLKLVPYDRLMSDFDRLMVEIADFLNETPSLHLRRVIRKTAQQQKKYQSHHRYDFARFGITPEQIQADYAPFYETFLGPTAGSRKNLF